MEAERAETDAAAEKPTTLVDELRGILAATE
jgi:hypothetical protein